MDALRDCESIQTEHYDKFEEPCKFISPDFEFVNLEHIKNRLSEQNTGFLVVGVIGKQSVGKSFLLNLLTNRNSSNGFETSSINDMLSFSPKTTGIDIHVTSDRVILLDVQPILNINHVAKSMEKEKKIKVFSNEDGGGESETKIRMSSSPDIVSVQLISYLLSVCHVVLVVDDHVVNYRLLRLIDLAHRLKPWISCQTTFLESATMDETKSISNDFCDEFHDYVAGMVFVENLVQKGRDQSDEQIAQLVDGINRVLIGYRSRCDEQNALTNWLKDNRDKQSIKLKQCSKPNIRKAQKKNEQNEEKNKKKKKRPTKNGEDGRGSNVANSNDHNGSEGDDGNNGRNSLSNPPAPLESRLKSINNSGDDGDHDDSGRDNSLDGSMGVEERDDDNVLEQEEQEEKDEENFAGTPSMGESELISSHGNGECYIDNGYDFDNDDDGYGYGYGDKNDRFVRVGEKGLNRSIYRPTQVVLMPFFDQINSTTGGSSVQQDSDFQDIVNSFQRTVFGLPRKHFCVAQSEQFTELCWIDYAVQMWHNIKNSQIFIDYFHSFTNVLINDI